MRLRRAVSILRAGGVIAYPTEAVFGIGCDPRCEAALARVAAIKRRRFTKGLILIASECRHLEPFVGPHWLDWIERHVVYGRDPSPPPVTWLVPARAGVPGAVTGRRSGPRAKVAVRLTSHPIAAALCHGFGCAVVSTSANTAAAPPARGAREARLRLGRYLDLVVPGATGGYPRPSSIRDAENGRTLRR